MKFNYLIVLFYFIANSVYCQITQPVEKFPEYPGGIQTLEKHIKFVMVYPKSAYDKNIGGKVFVKFMVDSLGKSSNYEVVRSINPVLDAEAIRIVSMLPEWIPGEQNGKRVNVSMTIPVSFDPNEKVRVGK